MKNIFLPAILTFLFFAALAQQEPQFTFHQYARHFYNPAAAGSLGGPVFTGIHRQQWLGFAGAPKTQLMSFHTPLPGQKAGAGLVLSRQRIGISSQFNAAFSYSYAIQMKEKTSLRVGLHASLNQYRLDLTSNEVVIESSGDPTIAQGDFLKNTTGNVGAGLLLNIEDRFLIGLSVPNMLPANLIVDSESNVLLTGTPHFYFSLLGKWKLYDDIEIRQAFLIKMLPSQLASIETQSSVLLSKVVTVGLNLRITSESTVESADIFSFCNINEELDLGLSFDFGVSKLRTQHAGSIELLVNYQFQKKDKDKSKMEVLPRYF